MISPDGGSTKLALFRGEPRGRRPTAGFHLVAFRVDGPGFLGFLGHVENAAVFDETGSEVWTLKPRDHGQAFSVYFCDPWGHRLEVTTYDAESVRQGLA
jgi:hypothetical protein